MATKIVSQIRGIEDNSNTTKLARVFWEVQFDYNTNNKINPSSDQEETEPWKTELALLDAYHINIFPFSELPLNSSKILPKREFKQPPLLLANKKSVKPPDIDLIVGFQRRSKKPP